MKWINHRMVTGAVIYAATENLVSTACAVIGSVWPDQVEGKPGTSEWSKRHRGLSHWPMLYLALLLLVMSSPVNFVLDENFNLQRMLAFMLVGALMHIAEDAFCGKVPVFTPRRKYGYRIFYVGTPGEYVFSVALIVLVYLLKANGF